MLRGACLEERKRRRRSRLQRNFEVGADVDPIARARDGVEPVAFYAEVDMAGRTPIITSPRRGRVVPGGWDLHAQDTAPLASALPELGVATWNIEYRQVGNPGAGGGTFLEAAPTVVTLRCGWLAMIAQRSTLWANAVTTLNPP